MTAANSKINTQVQIIQTCHHFGVEELSDSERRTMVRMFRNSPGTIEAHTCHELETTVTPAQLSTVKPRLQGTEPLLQNKNLQAQLKSAAAHVDEPNAFSRKLLWSDDTKIKQESNTRVKLNSNLRLTVKHTVAHFLPVVLVYNTT